MQYLRVFIVDDDVAFLAQAQETLSQAKYAVTTFTDHAKAANALKRARGRAVVLSGISVAGRSGLDFLADTLKRYPHIPFTFLAHSPTLDFVIEALQKGAYDFLRKPVDPEILRHSVARSIEKLNLTFESDKQEREVREHLSLSREELKNLRAIGAFKGFLISTAAHDFRSLLTVLDGYHQIIREKCDGCSRTAALDMLGQARRSLQRLRTMASTLLDYEAAEKGTLKVAVASVELDRLLRESARFYRPYAEQKRVDLDVESGLPALTVKADAARVMEVLDNLLYNALKFTPAGGKIRIGAKAADDGTVTAWVHDTGPGIPKTIQKKIFDETEIASKRDGNARIGLGLSICRKLLEFQKGRIWLESAPGKGTKIFISLPG